MNSPIPIFYSGKDGVLKVDKRPYMKRGGCEHAANRVQSADQAPILAGREPVLRIEEWSVEGLQSRLFRLLRGTRNCILTLVT